jgi:dipeptidyl-peptidase-3
VKVDQAIHAEVLERSRNVSSAPYSGFIQPHLEPVLDDAGEIIDIGISYPRDFKRQMLELGERFDILPDEN